jgi:hypothetical protein
VNTSMKCARCGKIADLSVRFCPQCGHPFFVDLSRKDLTGDMFLDVLNSLYNLIVTPGIPDREVYFHAVSRRLINRRYELEYNLELRTGVFASFPGSNSAARTEAINMRINSRSSNTLTGYAIRGAEEIIAGNRTSPLSFKEIENGINSFRDAYADEYLVKDIALHMSNEAQARRILFVFFLQDDNKHMNYFLDEPLLQRWFGTIIQTNTEATLQRYRNAFSVIDSHPTPRSKDIADEVLNDMVFGYCVKLSESLFPIGSSE